MGETQKEIGRCLYCGSKVDTESRTCPVCGETLGSPENDPRLGARGATRKRFLLVVVSFAGLGLLLAGLLVLLVPGFLPGGPAEKFSSRGSKPRIKVVQRFPRGDYEILSGTVQNQTLRVQGRTQKVRVSENIWFAARASEPDAAGHTIVRVSPSRVTQSASPGNSFDTDRPTKLKGSKVGRVLGRMLKEEFVLEFGPDGELISVKGMDKLWDDLAREEPRAAQVARQMKQTMGNRALKEMICSARAVMPKQPVGVGAVWQKTVRRAIPFMGPTSVDLECELTQMERTPEGKKVHVAYTGYIQSSGGQTTTIGPASVTVNGMNLRQTGTIQLNADTGLMLKQSGEMEGEIEMLMEGPRGKKVSASARVRQTSETTVKPVGKGVTLPEEGEPIAAEPGQLKPRKEPSTRAPWGIIPLFQGHKAKRPAFGPPTNLGSTVNSSSREKGPSISADGLSLYFDSSRPGGCGGPDLYVAKRTTTQDEWGSPQDLGPEVNSPTFDGEPFVSSDGLELYLHSSRAGGHGYTDIYVARRATTQDRWASPTNLGPIVNGSDPEWDPCISADGLTLYFTSPRSSGHGGVDIWSTTRASKDAPWDAPTNLGPVVNTPYEDSGPAISADGLRLFLFSNRPGGYGHYDLWVTTRKTKRAPWGEPINLGPAVNTACAECEPSISADGQKLYFCDFRNPRLGGVGGGDLWWVSAGVAPDGS